MIGNRVSICGMDTKSLPVFNVAESNELLKKIKRGDKDSREKFILGNARLVLSIIKRFRSGNMCADDLFQAGCIGLIKAIDNFNPDFNVQFSTYAVPMIIGEVKRFMRGRNSLRVSRSIRDTAYQAIKARESLDKGAEASIADIAKIINVEEKEVAYALDALADPVSLYDPVYNKSGDTLMLMDQLGDEINTDERWTENVALTSAIEALSEREKNIIMLRYYEGKTQTEISDEVGLSQAQVSRLEKTALGTVKNYLLN